jgi:hypothetical protein
MPYKGVGQVHMKKLIRSPWILSVSTSPVCHIASLMVFGIYKGKGRHCMVVIQTGKGGDFALILKRSI